LSFKYQKPTFECHNHSIPTIHTDLTVGRREAAAVNANRAVKKLKDDLDNAETQKTEISKVTHNNCSDEILKVTHNNCSDEILKVTHTITALMRS